MPTPTEESKEQKVIGKISKQPFGNETPSYPIKTGKESDDDEDDDPFANLDKKIEARQTVDKKVNPITQKDDISGPPQYFAPVYPGPPGMPDTITAPSSGFVPSSVLAPPTFVY